MINRFNLYGVLFFVALAMPLKSHAFNISTATGYGRVNINDDGRLKASMADFNYYLNKWVGSGIELEFSPDSVPVQPFFSSGSVAFVRLNNGNIALAIDPGAARLCSILLADGSYIYSYGCYNINLYNYISSGTLIRVTIQDGLDAYGSKSLSVPIGQASTTTTSTSTATKSCTYLTDPIVTLYNGVADASDPNFCKDKCMASANKCVSYGRHWYNTGTQQVQCWAVFEKTGTVQSDGTCK